MELVDLIDQRHELAKLAALIDWPAFAHAWGLHSIKAAMSAGVLKPQSLATVIVDTTVQPKAIAHPTDSRLLNRAREQLVDAAQDAGVELRQSYARVGQGRGRAGRPLRPRQAVAPHVT